MKQQSKCKRKRSGKKVAEFRSNANKNKNKLKSLINGKKTFDHLVDDCVFGNQNVVRSH